MKSRGMSLLLLKIFLAPSIITGLSLYGKRFGHKAAGLLAGLPLTSAPVAFILANQNGTEFAAGFSNGILSGIVYVAVFNVTYAWSCRYFNWIIATVFGLAAYAIPAIFIRPAWAGLGFTSLVSLLIILTLTFILPGAKPGALTGKTPVWDIPVRAALAAVMVFAITTLSEAFGPAYSGVVSSIPVFVIIFTVSTHRHYGSDHAIQLLKGILLSSFAFIAFFTVLGISIVSLGIAISFSLAILTAGLVQLILYKNGKVAQP